MKGDKDYYAKLGELVNKEVELKRERTLLIAQFDKKQADSANKLTEDAKKAAKERAKLEEEENKRLRSLNAERLQMLNELDDEIRLNKMNAYKAEQDDFEENLQKQLSKGQKSLKRWLHLELLMHLYSFRVMVFLLI